MTFNINPGRLRGCQKSILSPRTPKIFILRTAADLGAGPGGGLTHAQDRLVLRPVQPAGGQTSAADPSHHGDVAVSEEAMQKMRRRKGVEGGKRQQ